LMVLSSLLTTMCLLIPSGMPDLTEPSCALGSAKWSRKNPLQRRFFLGFLEQSLTKTCFASSVHQLDFHSLTSSPLLVPPLLLLSEGKSFNSLKDERGNWFPPMFAKTPGGDEAQIYVNVDKSPKVRALETATRKALRSLQHCFPNSSWHDDRRNGIISSSSFLEVAKVEVQQEKDSQIRFRDDQIPKLGLGSTTDFKDKIRSHFEFWANRRGEAADDGLWCL